MCVCVCVCALARVCVCVCACVCMRVHIYIYMLKGPVMVRREEVPERSSDGAIDQILGDAYENVVASVWGRGAYV